MSASATVPTWNASESVLQAFAVNERINQLLLSNFRDAAWRAETPGKTGRAIAEIFAHIHNVRLMWLKAAARDQPLPENLDRLTCTRDQVAAALSKSAQDYSRLIGSALAAPGGK